ncbi:sensor histidine kinase [Alicyclobacillus sp. ALC3]|uniref:sensor histidine kinase n=1 Tax=Alicyclobacillus sp. ALC3 TaxID=2796143 RepID=UPI0023787432|nr:histidine kinase [Alicyclobacillus sp. ALC3]WDL95752.1 ATP-binding protein [Alicyclobacillus sp. ALC3]
MSTVNRRTAYLHPVRLFPRGSAMFGYAYLLNLVIPAAFLTLEPNIRLVIIGAVAILAFAVIYVLSFWAGYRMTILCIALEIAMMVAMTLVLSPGYISMFFYPAALLGTLKRPHMQRGLAILIFAGLAVLLIPIQIHHEHVITPYWAMMGSGVLVAMATTYGNYMQAERARSQAALRRANDEIERLAQIAERERITQDLHDVMGHDLSIITLKSQLLERLIDHDADRARQEAHDIQVAARQALTRVREYIAAVREPSLLDEWRDAQRLIRTAGMECASDPDENLPDTRCEQSRALAMSLREAVTNAVRHSHAHRVALYWQEQSGSLEVRVEDDGQGMLPANGQRHAELSREDTGAPERQGNGINGIRARLSAVGGQVFIWSNGAWLSPSAPGAQAPSTDRGTVVTMRVPWPATKCEGVSS